MILSKRLTKVLDFIDEDDLVADIGADHGFLSLKMLEKGVKFVEIVENKKGPMEHAKTTLKDYENVFFSLSDGISDLLDIIDTVTICGMGGLNVVEIINNNLERAHKLKKIIIQANSKLFELREFLSNNGFVIVCEDIVLCKGTYYEIIVAKPSDDKILLSYEEKYFGPILLNEKSNTFIEKYLKYYHKIHNILSNSKEQNKLLDLKNEALLIENNVLNNLI